MIVFRMGLIMTSRQMLLEPAGKELDIKFVRTRSDRNLLVCPYCSRYPVRPLCLSPLRSQLVLTL